MGEHLEIMVLANAGVVIRAGDASIFVDILEDAGPYPFNGLPDSVLAEMEQGENKWRNAQYLIFSHEHPDHFTPSLIRRYLAHNTVRRLVIPNRPDKENQQLLTELTQSRAPVWTLPDQMGQKHTFVLQKDILLHTACTSHTGNMFQNATCNLLLFSLMGRNILLLSDCDSREPEAYQWLKDISIDLAFVNPFFFASDTGQQCLKRYINPKKVVVYHLSEEAIDKMRVRSIARQGLAKFGPDYPSAVMADRLFYPVELP